MLQRILAFSLNNRALILIASLAIAVLGGLQAYRSQIDVLPDLDRPMVSIMTEAHGLAPESVEQLVTWPIEQSVSGSTGVLRVRSTSSQGLSVVQIDFDWGTDLLDARQIVAEKLAVATERMPPDVHPQLAPIASIMGQIQLVGFRTTDGPTDAVTLRRLIDRDVRPRLLSMPGVAQVTATGGQPTELQITIDEDRLRGFDVTLQDVADAVRRANVAVAGSTLEIGTKGPMVAVRGLVKNADHLASAVVRDDPTRPVRISDIAQVTFGPTAIRVGSAGIDGKDGVIVTITKQPSTDTVEVTARIDKELELIRSALPDDIEIDGTLFRQSEFIVRAIDNVLLAVRDGAILVVIVLVMFLLNIRTTAITLLAIPLSVAIAAIVFAAFGLTINTMTLGGLAVAIGTLVDDAIVDVENVYRRLRENAAAGHPRKLLDVVLDASSEIRKPVFYGTLVVSVVYTPLFFLSGMEGRLLAPVGLAFLVSVAASLLVAMTLTPVLCSFWLGGSFSEKGEYGSPLAREVRELVASVVRFSISRRDMILATFASLCLCAGVVLFTRGSTFLPAFEEGTAQVNIMVPPDSSLATSEQFGRRLERVIAAVPGVRSVARRTGRAPDDEHAMPVTVSEAIVTFRENLDRSRDEVLDEIRHELEEEFPGVGQSTEQPLAHLLSHLLSGVNAQVAIKIAGPDLTVLRDAAMKAEHAIEDIPGIVDVFVEQQALVEFCEVRPRRADLARLGLDVQEVAESVELALGGEAVSRMQLGRVSWPIVLRLQREQVADPSRIAEIRLRASGDRIVRIGDVADVRFGLTPNEIRRENTERRIVVQHNVSGRALGDVVRDVDAALAPLRRELSRKSGYSIRLAGQFEAQQQASRTILWLSLASIAAIIFILHRHFGSLRLSLIVLVTRPIAFLGAVAAVCAFGQTLSIATLVGLIALLGIAARNAILYVDHAQALAQGNAFTTEVLVRAAQERVVPVLMTALTSGIGVLPLVLGGHEPGREILYPVATVIVGGLVTNTILDFVVTPGLLVQRAESAAD